MNEDSTVVVQGTLDELMTHVEHARDVLLRCVFEIEIEIRKLRGKLFEFDPHFVQIRHAVNDVRDYSTGLEAQVC